MYTSEEKTSLAVPETAIIDEDIHKVIYVQLGGETFEKRVVRTGSRFRGWTAIEEGLSGGERIVTKGAYQLKLAESVTDIGHPHVH